MVAVRLVFGKWLRKFENAVLPDRLTQKQPNFCPKKPKIQPPSKNGLKQVQIGFQQFVNNYIFSLDTRAGARPVKTCLEPVFKWLKGI